MKKKLLTKVICVAALMGTVLAFAGCGSSASGSASNDVWKYDTIFGSSEYNNRHTYFAKFDDTTGAVYMYSTDSQDATKLTALAVFNVTYEEADGTVTVSPTTGYVHAMNGDNAIDADMAEGETETWWSNIVGETYSFTLNDDGTLELVLE